MRSATVSELALAVSKAQKSAILLVTADPMCGNSAFQAIGFLPEDALATLKHAGTVLIKAESHEEYEELRSFSPHLRDAFQDEPRLGAEAMLFFNGKPIYQMVCDGVVPTELPA